METNVDQFRVDLIVEAQLGEDAIKAMKRSFHQKGYFAKKRVLPNGGNQPFIQVLDEGRKRVAVQESLWTKERAWWPWRAKGIGMVVYTVKADGEHYQLSPEELEQLAQALQEGGQVLAQERG